MNQIVLHRINKLEEEFDAEHAGEIDLRHVATEPMAEGNWADPQRTSFDAVGFGEPSPDLPWGWLPEPTPRNWRSIGMYCAVLAAVIFALAVICPTVPIR